MTVPVADIGTLPEAYELVRQTFGKIIKLTLGLDFPVVLAEKDTSIPTEPYASIKLITSTGEGNAFKGNTPIHTKISSATGDEINVFSNIVQVVVKFFKGDALLNANLVTQNLNTSTFHYNIFKSNGQIGLRGYTNPRENNVPIDQQGWESGALMTFTVDVLSKQVILEGLGVIEYVTGFAADGHGIKVHKTADKDVNESVTQDIEASGVQEIIDNSNGLYLTVNDTFSPTPTLDPDGETTSWWNEWSG